MKRSRVMEEEVVSLALSLSADSSSVSSPGSSPSGRAAKRARRRRAPASGEGDFVCKTCSRAFPSFQALGGHRTSHLRGRGLGLELGVVGAKALKRHKADDDDGKPQRHECLVCGLGFGTGQALGGHMRRHREEVAAGGGGADWVWRAQETPVPAAAEPPVLLQLFA